MDLPEVGAAPAVPSTPAPGKDDPFAALAAMESSATAVEVARPCPGCRTALPPHTRQCPKCGYDVLRGRAKGAEPEEPVEKKKPARQSSGPAAPGFVGSPAGVGLIQLVLLIGLFGLARAVPAAAPACALVLGVYSAVIGIWVLVAAFQDGALTGILTLIIPFYALYFVFAKSGNAHLQWAWGVSLISIPLRMFML